MKACLALLALVPLSAEEIPRILYTKSFPGSNPAYVAIRVERTGKAEYKEAPDDDKPMVFQLPEEDTAEIFSLAQKLDYFKRPLEANLKVANMGIKTFRYEGPGGAHEVKFNFTQDLDGRALQDWFERITETQGHLIQLERAVRFDRLGVNKALLLLEASYDRKRLVATSQFLPMLDRIVKNESFLHMARARAAALAEAFRGVKAGSQP